MRAYVPAVVRRTRSTRLADNPEPPASTKLGGTNLRRLKVAEFRATYEVDSGRIAVKVLMVGATAA